MPLPAGNLGLVALDGALLRLLAREAQPPQQMPRWPTLYSTPKRCAITLPMRGAVQSSVGKPAGPDTRLGSPWRKPLRQACRDRPGRAPWRQSGTHRHACADHRALVRECVREKERVRQVFSANSIAHDGIELAATRFRYRRINLYPGGGVALAWAYSQSWKVAIDGFASSLLRHTK